MCNDSARKFRTSKLIRLSNLLELIQNIMLTKEVPDHNFLFCMILNWSYMSISNIFHHFKFPWIPKNIATPLLRMKKKRLVKDLHFWAQYSNMTLINVVKIEKSSHYPVKDYSNESNERNCYSCNCLHWALDSFTLQNFPSEYCEEIGQGYCHCSHVPVVNVFHIGCLRDSIKAALKECIKT